METYTLRTRSDCYNCKKNPTIMSLTPQDATSNAQRVQKFAVIPGDFSVATGELGPTLKLKRHTVLEKHSDIIEGFYN